MSSKTIILSFDMEADFGSWTRETRGLEKGASEILHILQSHSCPATFLFTGREALSHRATIERVLSGGGHEIGCHGMQHEALGAEVFSMPGESPVLEEEVRGRIEIATRVVEAASGVRPRSFRAPRMFGSTRVLRVLDELGYVVDSSLPAYAIGKGLRPYHPSEYDWTQPGELNILEIPPMYDLDDPSEGEICRKRDQWPRLRMEGAEAFAALCRRMFPHAETPHGGAVLCLYLHPWEFVEMPARIETDEASVAFKPFMYERTGTPMCAALDAFIGVMRSEGVSFTTLSGFTSG